MFSVRTELYINNKYQWFCYPVFCKLYYHNDNQAANISSFIFKTTTMTIKLSSLWIFSLHPISFTFSCDSSSSLNQNNKFANRNIGVYIRVSPALFWIKSKVRSTGGWGNKVKDHVFWRRRNIGKLQKPAMKLTRWIWCTAVIPQWSRFRCQSFCWSEKNPWRTYPSNYSTIEARQMRLIVAYLFFDHTANTLKFKKVSITSSTALSELATISRKSTYRVHWVRS